MRGRRYHTCRQHAIKKKTTCSAAANQASAKPWFPVSVGDTFLPSTLGGSCSALLRQP
jgi:hypothetical protein